MPLAFKKTFKVISGTGVTYSDVSSGKAQEKSCILAEIAQVSDISNKVGSFAYNCYAYDSRNMFVRYDIQGTVLHRDKEAYPYDKSTCNDKRCKIRPIEFEKHQCGGFSRSVFYFYDSFANVEYELSKPYVTLERKKDGKYLCYFSDQYGRQLLHDRKGSDVSNLNIEVSSINIDDSTLRHWELEHAIDSLKNDDEFKRDIRGPARRDGKQRNKGEKGDTGPEGPQGQKGKKCEKGDTGHMGPQGPAGRDGKDGATGPQGPRGDPGAWGLAGPPGPEGPPGQKGDKGEKGDTRHMGPQGPAGRDGKDGARGPEGKQGEKGEKGDTGPEGPQGPKGEKGELGRDGKTGPQCPKGEKGNTGPQGPQGQKGEKGDKGDTGQEGPQGPRGEPGKDGARGPEGKQGNKGEKGDTGPVGPKGEEGDTGPMGPQGPAGRDGKDGSRGPEGKQGEKGDKGDTGPAGKNANHGKVAAAVVGSKVLKKDVESLLRNDPDFQREVKGDKGEKGDTGPVGQKGDKGDTGTMGPQGPAGRDGKTGPQGPKGEEGDQSPRGPKGEDVKVTYVARALLKHGNASDLGKAVLDADKDYHTISKQVAGDANFQTHVKLSLERDQDFKNSVKGEKGDIGPVGPEGPIGPQGETGPQGPEGKQGERGREGTRGKQGEKGDTGSQGPEGEKGKQGLKGDTGPKGEKGDNFTLYPEFQRSTEKFHKEPLLKVVPRPENYNEDIQEANIEMEGKGVLATFLNIGYFIKDDELYIRNNITGNNVLIPKDFHFLKVVEDGLNNYKLAFCNNLGNLFFDYKKYDKEYANLPKEYKLIDLKYIKDAVNIDLSKYYYHKYNPLFVVKRGELEEPSSENYRTDIYEIEKNKKVGSLIDEFGYFENGQFHYVDHHHGYNYNFEDPGVKVEIYDGDMQIGGHTVHPITLDDNHLTLLNLGWYSSF